MPGTLTFRPVEANLTHDTDWLGKMDPYCMFSVGGQRVKSSVCKHGGTRPHWGDTVTMQSLETGAPSVCRLEIMDKDRFRPDDNIAVADIDLTEIQSRGSVSRWYPLFHHRKPAGEILIEATYQPSQQGFVQQPLISQTFVPTTTQVYTEERTLNQGVPLETFGLGQQQFGQQIIGQSYETTSYTQGSNLGGFQGGLPLGTGLQGGLPLGQGFTGLQQGQIYEGSNYTTTNTTGLIGNNVGLIGNSTGFDNNVGLLGNNAGLLGNNTGFIGNNAGLSGVNNTGFVSSKTSLLGPQGGLPHGHHLLKGSTNAGYSERPGYTLGDTESNPTTQSNLDTNGGGLFNKPGRERRAEPYSLSNPGTYGIPHGQTIDTAGHLQPGVELGKQAPIGTLNHPGMTGYPDNYSVNSGLGNQGLSTNAGLNSGLGQQGFNQGQF